MSSGWVGLWASGWVGGWMGGFGGGHRKFTEIQRRPMCDAHFHFRRSPVKIVDGNILERFISDKLSAIFSVVQ